MCSLKEGVFMKDITLHTDSNTTATCVPNAFIDNFMADANGEFVKIYLYLLRCMNSVESFSISQMADKFEHTEKDIARALKYWEKMHILKLEYDTDNHLSGICLLGSSQNKSDTDQNTDVPPFTNDPAPVDFSKETLPVKESPVTEFPVTEFPVTEVSTEKIPESESTDSTIGPAYTRDEILNFQKDEEVQDLMFIAEKYLGRTLNPTDINAILYWHDTLRFSIDLIEYLIEYCVDKGHRNVRYMDKVAISWANSQIATVDQAKKAVSIHSQIYYGVMKAFGISGRNLVEFELNFIEKWTSTYGFSLDIIGEACKRTIQAIHQPSFEYADTILNNWNRNHVHHLEDIAVLDSAYQKTKAAPTGSSPARTATPKSTVSKNRFTNYPQRSYDYAELEKQLLNNSMQS
jgi:DnaD/phage-associated family protein